MGSGTGHHVSLEGTRCVVVGATAGIGRQAAVDMVAMGGDVVFVGRSATKLADALEEAGGGFGVIADIAEPADCARLIDEAVAHLGGSIDLLLTVVGVSRLGLVAEAEPDLWRECLLTNVMGPALVTKAAIPHMSENAFLGYFSSESVGMPYHGLVPYSTSKAGLEEMIRGIRAEHPELRLSCLRVGRRATPTSAGTSTLSSRVDSARPGSSRVACRPAMTARGLGRTIARICALAIEFDEIDFQDLVLRAPGGPFFGTMDELIAQMMEAQAEIAAD